MWIVMEYCDFGDLNMFTERFQQKLDIAKKVKIMVQISEGVAFLHHQNIVHRDIKPGNILLRSENRNVVAKLGDFGLSKFLDPNDRTFSMSSNVGTKWFKAPEFWDRQPDGRVRYHRNVDVYATGLTFAALLQANSGSTLVPKAEGSLEPFEVKMPIGPAAFTRRRSKHKEIRIVVQDSKNISGVKKLKSIIEAMTRFSPEARINAAEVERRINALEGQVLML